MLEACTTAIVTVVSAVLVTLDPELVYFAGPLTPLVDEVLPEVRRKLATCLPAVPSIRVVTPELGLSVARGAAYAGLTMTHSCLRVAVLDPGSVHRNAHLRSESATCRLCAEYGGEPGHPRAGAGEHRDGQGSWLESRDHPCH